MWRNVRKMLGFKPSFYCLACWTIVTPMICFGLTYLQISKFKPLTIERPLMTFSYTRGQEAIGWMLASFSMLPVLVVAIYRVVRPNGYFSPVSEWKDNLYKSLQSSDDDIQYTVFTLGKDPHDMSDLDYRKGKEFDTMNSDSSGNSSEVVSRDYPAKAAHRHLDD